MMFWEATENKAAFFVNGSLTAINLYSGVLNVGSVLRKTSKSVQKVAKRVLTLKID